MDLNAALTPAPITLKPEHVVRAILAAGLLFTLAANLPGHLTFDSVVALYEGQTGQYASELPFIAWVLGFFSHILPGTALFVTFNASLFFGSLLALTYFRRVSWLGVPVALAIVVSPLFISMEGTVWHDILFADLSLAAFVLLAFTHQQQPRPLIRVLSYAAVLILLSCAALPRESGIICLIVASVTIACAHSAAPRKALLYGACALISGLILTELISIAVVAGHGRGSEQLAYSEGLAFLERFDIVGTVHYDPQADLSLLHDPAAAAAVRKIASSEYTPIRYAWNYDAQSMALLSALPASAVWAQWSAMVLHDTGAYLQHRAAVFQWVMFTPTVEQCMPAYTGVSGPPELLKTLGLASGFRPQDTALYNYATYFFDTPVYAHTTYAIISILMLAALWLRRNLADVSIGMLLVSGLIFSASFFPISLACSYRYLFFMDAAAMTGLLYVALYPPVQEIKTLLAAWSKRK